MDHLENQDNPGMREHQVCQEMLEPKDYAVRLAQLERQVKLACQDLKVLLDSQDKMEMPGEMVDEEAKELTVNQEIVELREKMELRGHLDWMGLMEKKDNQENKDIKEVEEPEVLLVLQANKD